jgi:enoyl-CoA hydratase/carnithine racemase
VFAGIRAGVDRAESDETVVAVVLTGSGDIAFCSGADLDPDRSAFARGLAQTSHPGGAALRAVMRCGKPVIARINGACMAGGMGIMGMCDMAVASSQAVFGLPEVKVGLFPAQVLSVLGNLLPRRVLAEMCITGEPITAAQALEYRLVNHVSDDLDATVDWLLGRLLDKSPAAIRRGLYTMKKIEAMAFEESMAFTESQIGLFALTEDAAEGQLAFREKRKPQWSGR